MKTNKGMTFTEMMIVMVIFGFAIVGALTLLTYLTKGGWQEAARTTTTQRGMVSESILLRDVAMAGLGVPIEVTVNNTHYFVPIWSLDNVATTGAEELHSDQLVIKGAIISSGANDYNKWAYNILPISEDDSTVTVTQNPHLPIGNQYPPANYPIFPPFEGNQETGDRVVFLETEENRVLGEIYSVQGVNEVDVRVGDIDVPSYELTLDKATGFGSAERSALIFSIGGLDVANWEEYLDIEANFTGYRLARCVARDVDPDRFGICSLERVYGANMPLLDEVLDFQVQFGLIGVDGRIRWEDRIYDPDNQQFIITPGELRDQLRLIRLYIVKQYGKKDNSYYYPANFINTANHTITLCQCPAGVGVVNCNNQDIKEVNTELNNPELLHYRWRTIILDIPLRELP